MISKIIHQIYFKNIVSEYICYDKFINENQTLDRKINKIDLYHNTENHLSWIHNNKDWKYILWNDNSIKLFLIEKYPNYYYFYNKIKNIDIKRWFAKFIILYDYGGVYIDNDFSCYKNLNEILHNYNDKKVLISSIPYLKSFEKFIISNKKKLKDDVILLSDSIIFSERKHPFIIKVINIIHNFIIKKFKLTGIYDTSYYLSKIYNDSIDESIEILHHFYFIPCFGFDSRCKAISKTIGEKKKFLLKNNNNFNDKIFYIYFNYCRNLLKILLVTFIIFFIFFIFFQ